MEKLVSFDCKNGDVSQFIKEIKEIRGSTRMNRTGANEFQGN